MKLYGRGLFSLVLAGMCSTPVVGAPAAATQPAPTAVALTADSAAQAVLDAEKAVYANLNSYRVTFRMSVSLPAALSPLGATAQRVTEDSQIIFRRPNLLRLEPAPDSPISGEIVSDGTHLYSTGSFATGLYDEKAAPKDLLTRLSGRAGSLNASFPALDALLKTGIPQDLPEQRYHPTPTKLLPDAVIDGHSYQLVLVNTARRSDPIKIYLAIDPQTHLLRRYTAEMPVKSATYRIIVDLTDQQANPVLDSKLFAFTPPKDPLANPAGTLLRQMEAAYQQVRTFEAVSTASLNVAGKRTNYHSRFAIRRPDLVAVSIQSSSGTHRLVSDGKYLYQFSSTDPTTYTRVQATSLAAIGAAVGDDPGSGVLLQFFREGADPLDLASMGKELQSAEVQGPGTVAGVPVTWIVLHLRDKSTGAYTGRFGVGQSDHLMRSMQFSMPGEKTGLDVTLSQVRANQPIPASTFHFAAPRGARLVTPTAPAQAPEYSPLLQVGRKPIPFTAHDMQGQVVSPAQYHGRVLMLDFWATWCGPCVGEIPNVVATYKKYHSKGFDIVGISLDQPNSRGALISFLKQNGMTWRQVYDGGAWNAAVARKYGVRAIPFTVLIGRNGRIAALDVRGDSLPAAVQTALKG